jgi:CPA1 family monovalent cation:H+ antiporter
MRGIVTLAAALALPTGGGGGAAFPDRDLILFTAFSVVLGTLVLQGLTLRPLMTHLQLDDDGEVEREVRLARVSTLRAALEATAASSGTEAATLMRRRLELQLRRAEAELEGRAEGRPDGAADPGGPPSEDVGVVRAAMAAERQRLSALRADGTIGDAAFQQIEQELDWKELDLQQFLRTELT